MPTLRVVLTLTLTLGLCFPVFPQDAPALSVAHGTVEKADKESVSIKPRAASGQFQKTLVLKTTGTSRVSILTPQKRGDKVVLTQRDGESKDLVQGQTIAVIYTSAAGKDEAVLLSAVVQAAAK